MGNSYKTLENLGGGELYQLCLCKDVSDKMILLKKHRIWPTQISSPFAM